MKDALRLLGRDAVVYGLAGGVSRFVKVLLVPIVAKAYPAAVYGVFDSLGVYGYLAAIAAVLGLDSAVVLFVRPRTEDPAGRGGAATQALVMTAGAGIAVGLVVVAGRHLWSALLLGSDDFAASIAWAGAAVPFSALLIFALSLLKWEFRRGWFLMASLGSVVVSILLTWVVAFHTSYGLPGLFAASLCGQAAGAAIALRGCRGLFGRVTRFDMARPMLAIGLPFAVIGVAASLTPSIDRFFIVRAHSLADAGLYGVGQKIAALMALVLSGFQAAWGPFAIGMRDAPGRNQVFRRVLLLVTVWGVALATMLSFAAPRIAVVAATAEYGGAGAVVAPLALSAVLGAVYFIVSIGAFFEGRSLRNLAAYLAGVGVTLALDVAFTSAGAPPVAIAWANCGGQAAAVACMAVLAHRVHPIPFPYATTAAAIGAGAALATLAARAAPALGLPALASLLLATAVTFGLVTWFAIFQPAERRAIQALRRVPRAPGRIPRQ